MIVHLYKGGPLLIDGITGGGFVTAPIGAYLLGGFASRDLVGKYVLVVQYEDGQTGLIAQEEIADVVGRNGMPISWGNSDYPGHPDYDPRSAANPWKKAFQDIKRVQRKKQFPGQ